jgi:hypothetical protein
MEEDDFHDVSRDLDQITLVIKMIDEMVRLEKMVLTPSQECDLERAKIVVDRIKGKSPVMNAIMPLN